MKGVVEGWQQAMRLVEDIGKDDPEQWNRGHLLFAICAPENHTIQQALDIVIKYLREHPERRDRGAALSVPAALSEAWSCLD